MFSPTNLQNKDTFVTLAAVELAMILVPFQRDLNAMIATAGTGSSVCDGSCRTVILGAAAVVCGGVWGVVQNVWGICNVLVFIISHDVRIWKRRIIWLL